MIKKMFIILIFVLLLIAVISGLFFIKTNKKNKEYTRSVTAMQVKILNPVENTKLTGVVEAWKEENLSFEVPGRIDWVIDKGIDVYGSQNEYGLAHGEGEIVASLAPEEYEVKLKAAKANVDTVQAKINALKVTINEVVARQLDAAKAEMDNAEKEYNRYKKLFEKEAVSEKIYDTSDATYKKCQAKYRETNALIKVKEAELKGLEANYEQCKQEVADAELNLSRTELRVPFKGKIADVYANVGANVKPGEPVVKLVVMDPVIIELNISPQLDKKLHYCQFVSVYPPGTEKPITALVNRKAAVADPNSHTFALELLVRNRTVNFDDNLPENILKLPEIKGTWPTAGIDINGREQLVIITDCVYHDTNGDYLWIAKETEKSLTGVSIYKLHKVYVKVSEKEYSFLGVYKFKIIEKVNSLKIEEVAASGVPENVKDGDEVKLVRKQRMFRPGDLVKVVLNTALTSKGIYIPMTIVSGDTDKYWLYKVEKNQKGEYYAKQIFIQPKELFNDWVLIESPDLKEGDKIVVEGAHFLVPNEKINIKSIEIPAL